MAFIHGKGTRVYKDGLDLTGYLRGAELALTGETADTTTFANDWRTAIAGLLGGTFSAEGLYDPALVNLEDTLSSSGVLTYCPGVGTAIGNPARLIPMMSTSVGQSAPIDDAVGFAWEVIAEDAIAFGQVLHPHGEDTNTTVGSSKDDTASTSTGWTANLHVTLVDGGSWVVKLEDSANNSDWSDVTGGAFTAATAATGQQLRSAAGTTTLRRYVRYTATRTGGSVGHGITFHLSYARSNQT